MTAWSISSSPSSGGAVVAGGAVVSVPPAVVSVPAAVVVVASPLVVLVESVSSLEHAAAMRAKTIANSNSLRHVVLRDLVISLPLLTLEKPAASNSD
jgi:hypothetical protein